MELEITVKEASNGLKSSRATDRKRNAEILKDFLSRNAVPSILSRNTLQTRGFTWNNLYDDINELIFKETEKYETSKTYSSGMRPLCASLLHACVAGANRGKAHIKCDKITESSVYILNDKRLAKAIGDEYLSLLLKHVFPYGHYLSYITPNAWKELLDVSITACLSEDLHLDNYAKLRIIYLIINNAQDNCQFVRPLVDSLPKLERCFTKVTHDKKAHDIVLDIIIVLLEALSTEYRLTMCYFTEKNLPFLLKYYDQNKDHKKKSTLFKLFTLTVEIHHPLGRLQDEEGSLADNWDLWNRYLKGITEIICLEVGHLQKNKKHTEKYFQQCPYFCHLASFVYYQMFRTLKKADDDIASTSKRLKLTFNNNKSFSDLINELHQNHLPWLGIIHTYVKFYSKNIATNDYMTLLNHLHALMASDNINIEWEAFEELTCLVLKELDGNKGDGYDAAIVSMWNTCIRYCTAANSSHKTAHSVIQFFLQRRRLEYEHVQQLTKLYFERDMPVTDYSVKSLITVINSYYNKCSSVQFRVECLNWLTRKEISHIHVDLAIKLILTIVSSENLSPNGILSTDTVNYNLHHILFNTINKSILFTEFEEEIPIEKHQAVQVCEHIEMIDVVNQHLQKYFMKVLGDNNLLLRTNTLGLLEYIKFINIVLSYLDMIIKHNFQTPEEIVNLDIYALLKTSLVTMFSSLVNVFKSKEQVPTKSALINLVHEILMSEYNILICDILRLSIDENFFHCVNNILNTENEMGDCDVIIEGDDREVNMHTFKHNCVYALAAYCRKNTEYREDILKLILNPDLYNFSSDTECIFRCIEILMDAKVEDHPYEMIFKMLQFICKDLYRDSKVSLRLLKVLVNLIDHIYCDENSMRENCFIMVRGYVQLSEDSYYSPRVAALIYECVAKIAVLNHKQNNYLDTTFENVLTKKLKGNVHSIRLYCSYLLKDMFCGRSQDNFEVFFKDLMDIFTIEVEERNGIVLKDEAANRTFTVLHTFLAAAQGKKSSIQNIVLQVINLQKMKSLDKNAVKKVLNKIIAIVNATNLETYLNDNILSVLHFWFSNNNSIEDLPLYLFAFDNLESFIKRHMKWLVAADILWRKKGHITESDVLKRIAAQGLSADSILEECFSNIVVLCLPYIVSDKCDLNHFGFESPEKFAKSKRYAQKLYQSMGELLENNRWSNLFVENVGELLLLTASHLCDNEDTERLFEVKVPLKMERFYYPKQIFSAILDYFRDLTDGSVIQYLCDNQTTTIFNILVDLWKSVIQENIFEYKALALHAFLTFLQHIPLNSPSDVFMCNFVCKSFTHAISECCNREEIRVYIEGLKISLRYLLPSKISVMRTSVLELLPVLVIKKEEGFEHECSSILDYLMNDMKAYLKDSEDVVDFLNSISQSAVDSMSCSSITIFLEKLKSYKISLKCPSYETLANILEFLKSNKHYVRRLWRELESKRFSEDCKTSIVHEIVNSLGCIIKSKSDDKTVVAACNCLSEIGTYDLKTLVTLPPPNMQDVSSLNPKHYFAATVVKSLLEVLYDKNPLVTRKVAATLTSLLKSCQVADYQLEWDEVQKQLLKPFMPAGPKSSGDIQVDNMAFEQYCDTFPEGVFLSSFVTLSNVNDHWLIQVTSTILKVFMSTTNCNIDLQAVCALKPKVCRIVLPALVGLLVQCLSERQLKVISQQLNIFFNHIWELTFDSKVENSAESRASSRTCDELPHGQKIIVQHMLDIVDFVRVQRSSRARCSGTKQLNYLEVEYDKVAWSAAIADQNWAAIYYGELWAVFRNNGISPSSPESTTNLVDGDKLQQIFRKCYVSIGEIDAIEGCGTAHLTIEDEKRKHLLNTGQFSDALLMYDIALSCGNQVDKSLHFGAVRALHKSGMHYLALQYIKSQPENEDLNDIKYECLSFLGDWSEFVDLKEVEEKSKLSNCHHNSVIKAFHYACLKSCLNIQATAGYEDRLSIPLNKAKLAISRLCQNLNIDNCQNIYRILAKIHLFNDIDDYFAVRTNTSQMTRLLEQWDIKNMPQFHDFKHIEALVSQRVVILEHAVKSYENLLSEISSLQIQYAKLALSNSRVEMAQRLLGMAKKYQSSNEFILVESEISWAKGHKDIALSLLYKIVTSQTIDHKWTAVSMRQYALWMAESRRDNPREIINKYLLKSVRYLKQLDGENMDARLKLYHDIAKFADAEYKQVVAYMNSSVYEERVKCVEDMKGTASSLYKKSQKKLTKEEVKALATNEKFKALDEAEIANTRMEKDNFLQLAMRYYLMSLRQCDENNLSVFRVISLWLENQQFEFNASDRDTISFEELLRTIPSWKFIAALPQLAPHLTDEDTAFIRNLKMIINRCAIDHPHHTLPILFGLKNSNKDNVIMNASRNIGSASQLRSQEARTVAAHGLVRALADENDELSATISQMEKLCDAIISFANYKVQSKQSKQKIPEAEMLHKLRNLNSVPIPTVTIPVRADCEYSNVNTLKSFDPHFELVGGVNCPKKVNCKDCIGKNHVILIKGQDDLRQDAVMQQVFNIVNTLLEKDPVTNRNKLLIRTYKVVPMSRQSGVLEWCEGTIPLGGYLVGPNGAHARYRPQDISSDAARKKMIDCQNESHEEKFAVFNRILREFKPVFHYFFTEHYLDPVVWYERRLAYTKSVATSSMVGYILGLGDRHVFNILIDKRTAEVIHIDLGIAFDQGKTLRTPETVPFRLTGDIVSGFGCSGVEGIFRRSCEKTMQLLRDNQETLVTILEVLLCDPLYSWSVKTAQHDRAARHDNDIAVSESASGLAARALLVVSSKLCGAEAGAARGVAARGHVARLLHAARDPRNLCRLFHGWQPYL